MQKRFQKYVQFVIKKSEKLVNEVCLKCNERLRKEEKYWKKQKKKDADDLAKALHEKKANKVKAVKAKQKEIAINKIILTTEVAINIDIIDRIEIITAECVLGMNIFKDIAASFTDVLGGRSVSTQKTLRDLRTTVLYELKREAYELGANMVVGVDLDYSEFSGGKKSMLFLVASGTAIKANFAGQNQDRRLQKRQTAAP